MTTSHDDLTLAEAASLLSGADMASTVSLPAHGIPSVVMTDGSNGVAMNLPDFSGKVAATCFPSSSAIAASWDPELVARVAARIAVEAKAAGAQVLLSPGMNLKRSPLGGRNFEYYSEDPILTGELAVGFVRGVQGQGIGACVKHFVANNQETDRMRVSAEVSERALRELYLRAFETVVTRAAPWLVMASYNKVNGTYVSEDPRLLTGVLRTEWGFEGVVVSDWGAVDDRERALRAGLDLEMPSTSGASAAALVAAVERGALEEGIVRRSAERVAALARRAHQSTDPAAPVDADPDALAVTAAERSIVLLANDGALPLDRSARVAVVGAFALAPRFQGGGSAGVNARRSPGSIVDALDRLRPGRVAFAAGYDETGTTGTESDLAEAVATAAAADVAIVVVGTPESAESEGYDRADLDLPAVQDRLVREVAAVTARTVVVVISGGPVRTEAWRHDVHAVIATGLAGQGISDALAAVLCGDAEPSGRLAETWPVDLADTPSHLSFPGEAGISVYGEGVFVGYRGHDLGGGRVAFAFGHGLSYATFEYSGLRVRATDEGWSVSLIVRNPSERGGREVVQLYVEPPESTPVRRPVRTLAAFESVLVDAGASREVTIEVPRRALERWDERLGRWTLDAGAHHLAVGASSRDVRLRAGITPEVADDRHPVTRESTLVEWLQHPVAGPALLAAVGEADPTGRTLGMLTNPVAVLMIGGLPIHRLAVDAGNALTEPLLAEIAARL
ncbi:beta-glucosidase [Agromyces sp. CFH 90414]|uniref:Beta-glucosidase n=1 Tax=Agromyces agglutinans TaxID=2662258 RepID=A0A6I2F793_9MICO|nr:glycoside hydrolase family 3 protein [Agromyces agglutinans]MRG58296.1 beta-glucosidase [Agromyces agglutinans]